jgi:hypothetical protein
VFQRRQAKGAQYNERLPQFLQRLDNELFRRAATKVRERRETAHSSFFAHRGRWWEDTLSARPAHGAQPARCGAARGAFAARH